MSVWRWTKWLPPVAPDHRVDIGAGATPLVRSRRIGPTAGLDYLFFKDEGCNPTGSYKDRYATVAISAMCADQKTRCLATSSGNTGAALAAHCAAAGLSCQIAIIDGAPTDKLDQMRAYGAEIFMVKDFGLDADVTGRTIAFLQEQGERPDSALQISAYTYSPIGMEGVKTMCYELVEQMEGRIDHVFSPVGGGGLTLAMTRGFADLMAEGELDRMPRVHCVQPSGNDTVAGPLRDGAERARPVTCTSKISGLQVASVIDGDRLIPACRHCGGSGFVVEDEVVWDLQAQLSQQEGVFCEPAGAVALAGALAAHREGLVDATDRTVCLVTGSGFKDHRSIERMLAGSAVPRISLDDLLAGRRPLQR